MSSSDGYTEPGDHAQEENIISTGDNNKHDSAICSESSSSKIKSCAVVKYCAAPPASTYALLQEKTDLKLPPANWLRENAQLGTAGTTVLGSSSKGKPFSSFGMAYDFIDCIGDDVDVVSDSENIKKLLKIPYSKSHVSMAVHRVGRTLLLDELDIQELFMRSSQTGDWTWLKDFYQRLMDQKWQRKKKSKEHWYQKAILSKFLYYSINGDCAAEPVAENLNDDEECGGRDFGSSWPTAFTSSDAEESAACKQERVPMDSKFALGQVTSAPQEQNLPALFNEGENSQGLRNDFVRNIMWTFEDIHMLVGSNMPIFGGGRYPAVSLKLRDNNKPINILTGIDYWLDNLMCNVPELVMCFHVNGIVQKYEMIKTEDIPHLENSTFSTRVVKDIAQNILSFLKSNCTKEGHTYWLFKASGSDIVKLYDLTTLCEEAEEEKSHNPFTLPVAVLLYKVACNLMLKARENRKHYGTIRTLLLNCVKLLDQDRHPQIIASAHYMLSELFQLDEPQEEDDDGGESFRACGSEDSYSNDDREEEDDDDDLEDESDDSSSENHGRMQDASKAVAVIRSVGELSVPEKYKSTQLIRPGCAFPISQDKEERCRHVLNYVLKGLKAVDGSIKKESELPAVDPNTPIPLKYEDGSAVEKGVSPFLERVGHSQADQKHPTRSGMIPGTWQHQMKLQLFLKASKAYYVLSDAATNLLKYGRALRYIKLSLQSYDAYCAIGGTLHPQALLFHSHCLSLCGDIQLMLAQNSNNRAAYQEEYSYQTKEDQEILHSLHRESSCQAFNMATDLATDLEYQLFVSSKCYEAAYELLVSHALKEEASDQLAQVLKRLGNIRNEMGVYYMNQAAAMQTEQVKTSVSAAEQEMWKKSFAFFEKGMKDFEAIGDSTNKALLLCNTGKLMRICAQAHSAVSVDDSRGEFSPEEALYYHKAIDYYLRAMRSLSCRENHQPIWDSVNWELSTTYFTLATLLQDYAPLSRKAPEQIEREVTEAMMKSLKYCDLHTESARQLLYQYRAATIHHRLASMYHSCFRNQVGDERLRKHHRSLAELHYSKAVYLFLSLKDAPCELLRALLERVAFAEFTMAAQNSSTAKQKSLTAALEIMAETRCAFQMIHKELLEEQTEGSHAALPGSSGCPAPGLNLQEVTKLTALFESRFSDLLLQLIKLMTKTKRKPSKKDEELLQSYKNVYSKLLRCDKNMPLLARVGLYAELLHQLTPNADSYDANVPS
ncbi:erythroid differentiation-related factor 1 isoform X2 [Hippocampus comes]|uniref:erythroid differentiation-related factor 1 isoform X2 n=1 Tax=Hippocampus comes TaxID=109280 RepID=UPI00094E3EB8|nr:PREDICTED: erythroid differentiation-related factor 1 isoform X2 [Hippocampus comes]